MNGVGKVAASAHARRVRRWLRRAEEARRQEDDDWLEEYRRVAPIGTNVQRSRKTNKAPSGGQRGNKRVGSARRNERRSDNRRELEQPSTTRYSQFY